MAERWVCYKKQFTAKQLLKAVKISNTSHLFPKNFLQNFVNDPKVQKMNVIRYVYGDGGFNFDDDSIDIPSYIFYQVQNALEFVVAHERKLQTDCFLKQYNQLSTKKVVVRKKRRR